MVQAAHLGERDDLALLRTLHWSWFRGIFIQAQMGPTPVVEVQSTIPRTVRKSRLSELLRRAAGAAEFPSFWVGISLRIQEDSTPCNHGNCYWPEWLAG
jgi:hypothetical protein